jgi:hypothetical protein
MLLYLLNSTEDTKEERGIIERKKPNETTKSEEKPHTSATIIADITPHNHFKLLSTILANPSI